MLITGIANPLPLKEYLEKDYKRLSIFHFPIIIISMKRI